MKKLGIYIHIPFCVQKCLYCDFCSFPKREDGLLDDYASALCREIKKKSHRCKGYTVDTVYFGGGTPTLLDVLSFQKIIKTLYDEFKIDESCEMSCECNPATVDADYLLSLRRLGINRMSVGVQSSSVEELAALGRIHTYDDFLNTYKDIRKAGFDNVSVDLMYGIPEQTIESFGKTLEDIVSLDAEHISAYGLKLEEGTPFGKIKEKLRLPDEDTEYEMYMLCGNYLLKKGYAKYEISNFSRRGFECRHNLKYWLGDEYIGFGVSAHSYFGGERFSNSRDILSYVKGLDICESRTKITAQDKMTEYVMLRMRLCRGVDHAEFERRFGCGFESTYGYKLDKYLSTEYIQNKCGSTAFTDKGFFVSNYILSDILDFD